MIPFLLIGGGAYLIFESLGTNRSSFDPLDYGFPTKGYRGYRKGKSYLASGGEIKSYKDFKAKLLDLANQESDRNAFAEKVKSDLKKYIPLYFSNSRRDILNVTDNQYRLYMTKPGQYAKELNSITWESVYDKLKGKMEKGGETSLIGKRIRLIKMENDPRPVEPGTMGIIKHVGGGVYNVDWDNGRSLGVVEGEDEFEIIN